MKSNPQPIDEALNFASAERRVPFYCVVIRPRLVATIQRLPQRTIESIVPTPGTLSPHVTFQMPLGPSKTALPSGATSRTVQPSIVLGLVSGTAIGRDEIVPVGSPAAPANFDGVL